MRLSARLLVLSTLLGAAGCSDPKKDFEIICDAPHLAGVDGATDPSERAMKLATFLKQNLKSSEAKQFFQSLASSPGEDHATLLRAEAARYGITPCPLADAK